MNSLNSDLNNFALRKTIFATNSHNSTGIQQDKENVLREKVIDFMHFVSKSFKTFKIEQFANLHSPLHVQNTSLEGSHTEDSLEFWIEVIEVYLNYNPALFDLSIKQADLIELKEVLKNYQKYTKLMCSLRVYNTDEPSDIAKNNEVVAEMHGMVLSDLKSKNYSYMNRGYRGTNHFAGHHIPFRLSLHNKKTVYFYPLNKGAGAEDHALLSITETQYKQSFRNFPTLLSLDLFSGELGNELIAKDVTLNLQAPPVSEMYGPEDAIESSKSIGSLSFEFIDGDIKEWEGTTQLGNTCASKGVFLIILDFLICKKYPMQARKRLFYFGKILSITSAYNRYTYEYAKFSKNPFTEKYPYYLRNTIAQACINFSNSIEKLDSTIFTLQEKEFLEKVIDKVLEIINTKTNIGPPVDEQAPFNVDEPDYPHTTFLDDKEKETSSPIPLSKLDDPEQLGRNLEQLINDLIQKETNFETLQEYVKGLLLNPKLLFDDDLKKYLDKIPPEKVPNVVAILRNFVVGIFARKSIELVNNYNEMFLATSSAYAITDYLLRKNSNLKLEKYYSQFWPIEIPGKITVSFSGNQDVSYQHILKYFKESSTGKKPLFDFPNEVDLAASQMDYYDQFIHAATELERKEQLEKLWLAHDLAKLPKEFYALRDISFFSYLLVNVKKGNFPTFYSGQLYSKTDDPITNSEGHIILPFSFEYYKPNQLLLTESRSNNSSILTLSKIEFTNLDDPNNVIDQLKELTSMQNKYLLEKFFLTVQCPSSIISTTQIVWDKIPQEIIPEAVLLLRKSLESIFQGYSLNLTENFTRKFLVAYTIYAITDYLVRKLPEAKLEGFYSQYWVPETKFDFTLFHIAEEESKYEKICQYFGSLTKGRKPLFYFSDYIHLKKGVDSLSQSNINFNSPDPSIVHLRYLDQFWGAYSKSASSKLETKYDQYKNLWMGKNLAIPYSFYHLRFISFHCRRLINETEGVCEYKIDETPLFSETTNPEQLYLTHNFNKKTRLRFNSKGLPCSRYDQRLYADSLHRLEIDSSLKNENEAFTTSWKKYKDTTKGDLQSIYRILENNITSPAAILEWIYSNLEKLSNPFYQNFIEKALLPKKYLNELVKSPSFSEKTLEVLTESIRYSHKNEQTSKTTFFLFHIAFSFENHRLYFNQTSFSHAENFIKLLETSNIGKKFIKQRLTLLLCFYGLLEKVPNNRMSKLISAGFSYVNQETSDYWLEPYAEEALVDKKYEIEGFCQDHPEQAKECLKEFLLGLHPKDINVSTSVNGSYPIYKIGPYYLNVSTLEITNVKGTPIVKVPKQALYIFLNAKIDISNLTGTWVNENEWISIDEKYRLVFGEGNQANLYRKVNFDGKEEYCSLDTNTYKSFPRVVNSFFSEHSVWKGKGNSWFFNSKTDLPEYCLRNFTISKTTPNGQILPIKMVNYKDGSEQRNAVAFFDIDTKTYTSAHFPNKGLHFIRKDNLLKSTQSENFHLLKEHSIGYLKGCIFIRSNWDEVRVTVPAMELIVNYTRTVPLIEFSTTYLNSKQALYFSYTYLKAQKIYHNDSPTANLYLVYVFSAQNNFGEALRYLERSKKLELFDLYDWKIIILILKNAARSPEALGFYLKLAYMAYKNFEIPTYSSDDYKKQRSDFKFYFESFEVTICKYYTIYLRSIHTDQSNQIPYDAKLSRKEEKVLITNLKANVSHLEEVWNFVLEQRHLLFTSRYYDIQRYLQPQAIATSVKSVSELEKIPLVLDPSDGFNLECFSNLLNPVTKFLVRIEVLKGKSIIYLIDKAKKAEPGTPHPIDLDIFHLSRHKNKSIKFIAALLLYIRNNPSPFSKFTFTKVPAEDLKTFEAVVAKAHNLKNSPSILSRISAFNSIFSDDKTFYPPSTIKTIKLYSTGMLFIPTDFRKVDPEIKKDFMSPLRKYQEYFTFTEESPTEDIEFTSYLDSLVDSETTKIESKIIDEIKQGNKTNLTEKKAVYKLVKPFPTEELKNSTGNTKAMTRLLSDIEYFANEIESVQEVKDLAKELTAKLRYKGQQTPHISLDNILIEAFLTKNSGLIIKQNELNQEKLNKLMGLVLEYMSLEIRRTMANQALEILANAEKDPEYVQKLGELCHWKSPLDPYEYPEIPVYMYKAGIIPRPNQLIILNWLLERICTISRDAFTKFMFAFEAGGGKTSVVQTILMAYVKRMGYFPISFSSDSLYPLDKANQKGYFLKGFNQHMSVVETSLNVPIGEEEIKNIESHLKEMIEEKNHLKMVPETFENLFLLLIKALDFNHTTLITPLLTILYKHFEEKGFAFVDEGQHNLTTSRSSKIALGKPQQLNPSEIKLFNQIVQIMVGLTNDPVLLQNGKTISETLGLTYKHKSISAKEWENFKLPIAKELLKYYSSSLNEENQNLLLQFWTNPQAETPSFVTYLLKTNPEHGEKLILIRGLLCYILPNALNLKYKFDYKRSIKKEEEFYTPSKRTKSSTTVYEDAYFTLFLTYRGFFQKGLSKAQISRLIKKLQHLNLFERQSNIPQEQRTTEKLWNAFTQKQLPPLSDYQIDPSNITKQLIDTIKHNKEAILWYVNTFVADTITFSEYQYEVTPVHLMNTFKRVIFFSAYPGLRQQYPFHPKNAQEVEKSDAPFVANTLKQLLAPQNQRMIVFPSDNLATNLEHAWNTQKDLFESFCAFINVAGANASISTETFARTFLEFSEKKDLKYDGFIFFVNSKTSINDDAPCYFLRTSKGTPEKLLNTDLPESLKYLNLRWKDLKLATLYDPSKTTGAHVVQPKNGCATFMVGKNVPLGEAVQAVNRMRDFFKGQKIVWGITQEENDDLKTEMNFPVINPKTLVKSHVRNQARLAESEIMTLAYKEIDYHLQAIFFAKLKGLIDYPEVACAQFQKVRLGFRKPGHQKPSERFLNPATKEPIADVLMRYAKQNYEKFKYTVPFEKNTSLLNELKIVIDDKKDLIAQFPSTPAHLQSNMGSAYKVQQQVSNNQTDQLQTTLSAHDIHPTETMRDKIATNLDSKHFLSTLLNCSKSANKYFECNAFDSKIYYTVNSEYTVHTSSEFLLKYKPPNFFLFLKNEKNELYAFGLTDLEASMYLNEFKKNPTIPLPHQVMLVNSKGWIYFNPTNGYRFKDAEKIVNTDAYKQIVCQISFINGELYYPEQFVKFVERTPNFPDLWKKVKERHINPEKINVSGIEAFAFGKKKFAS